jgi:hypothetical protein
VSGEVLTPPGYALQTRFMGLTFGGLEAQGPYTYGLFLDEVYKDLGGAARQPYFFYEVPAVPFAAAQVCAQADSLRGNKSVTCNSALGTDFTQIQINAAPEPTAPWNGGLGCGYDTAFQWRPFDQAEGIYVVTLKPNVCDGPGPAFFCGPMSDDGPSPKYVIITAGEETRIPDLRELLGFALQPSTEYSWRVRFMGPFESTDDFVSRPWVSVPPFNSVLPPNTLGGDVAYWAKSVWSTFTTCPDLSDCP